MSRLFLFSKKHTKNRNPHCNPKPLSRPLDKHKKLRKSILSCVLGLDVGGLKGYLSLSTQHSIAPLDLETAETGDEVEDVTVAIQRG